MVGEDTPQPPLGDSLDLAELLVEGVRELLDASPATASAWRDSTDELFRRWQRWLTQDQGDP